MALYLKNNEITSTDITSTGVFKQKYNRDGLILHLDATDVDSYPGSGTTWFDLSPLGNNFEINPSAFNSSTSTRYMDFNGSYGCAKKECIMKTKGGKPQLIQGRPVNFCRNSESGV
jgi:hypothetical protein